MNAMMNKTQLWCCDICNKTINIKSKSKRFNSKTQIHKKKNGVVFKDYEIIKPESDGIRYIIKDVIKDCRDKFFHTFEYRCVIDITSINIANNEEVL